MIIPFRRFPLVLLLITLAGCGGSRSRENVADEIAPAPAPPPRPAAVADQRRVLVAFGDSLTAGFGLDPARSFPAWLQRDIDRRNLPWRVVNEGVSGDTTSGGLQRVGMVLAHKPEIVILELGGNDGLRGLPLASTRANLEQIIGELKTGSARIVLAGITLPPNYGPDYIRGFEQIYKDLAARHDLPFIPFLLEGVATRQYMQSDGIHPTAEGNRRVAALVMKTLEPLLKKN
jgi:acyl-CoA thioesterase I